MLWSGLSLASAVLNYWLLWDEFVVIQEIASPLILILFAALYRQVFGVHFLGWCLIVLSSQMIHWTGGDSFFQHWLEAGEGHLQWMRERGYGTLMGLIMSVDITVGSLRYTVLDMLTWPPWLLMFRWTMGSPPQERSAPNSQSAA